MDSKSCVICGSDESEGELLVAAPCHDHWVCPDDVSSFFERATENESLFPPKCCGQMFMLQEYEDYVPFDIAWAYQVKEQGEYAVLAKFRVYCANPTCAKFLHPTAHITDAESTITYAICENEKCAKLTCTSCKMLIDHSTQNHACAKDGNEEKFKQIVTEKGYQECSVCGATVELTEACNHITCGCGNDFCYICGNDWPGLHGCPHYGPATYDTDGYNQDGYHRDVGLNREGLTRRQDMARRRGEDDPDGEGDVDEEDDEDWEVLQHLELEQRVAVNVLHAAARRDALDQARIVLFETRGIVFGGERARDDDEVTVDSGGELDEDESYESEDENDTNVDAAEMHPHAFFDFAHLLDDNESATHGEVLADDRSEHEDENEYLPPYAYLPIHDLPTNDPIPTPLDNLPQRSAQLASSVPLSSAENGDLESPPTEPEDTHPAAPIDVVTPGDTADERAETVAKEGVQKLWGPPGGWPVSEDEEEL